MTLPDLQRVFWQAMRADIPPGAAAPEFAGDKSLPAVERLWIYRRMYWARQIEALRDCFPLLLSRLEGERFEALARAYVVAHPSEDPCIERLGRRLPEFMRDHPDAAVAQLADMAAIEWALVEVLLMEDPQQVARGLDVPQEVFPTCRIEWVAGLRLLSLADDPFEATGAQVGWAVWRRKFSGHHRRLAPDERRAIDLVNAGTDVAGVCTAFADAPDPAARAFAVLGQWLNNEWVARITVPDSAVAA